MKPETAAKAIGAVLVVVLLVAIGYQWHECSSRGGSLIRGILGFECLR